MGPCSLVPVARWTPSQVAAFVASTDAGRFADLVLPAGLDGKGLLSLTSARLANLFEGTLGTRGAWVIGSGDSEALGEESDDGAGVGDRGRFGGVGAAEEGGSSSGFSGARAEEERARSLTSSTLQLTGGGGSVPGLSTSSATGARYGHESHSTAAAEEPVTAAAVEEEVLRQRRRRRRTIGEDLFLAVRQESQRITQVS